MTTIQKDIQELDRALECLDDAATAIRRVRALLEVAAAEQEIDVLAS